MSWLAEHAFSERSLDIAWKKVQKRESDDGNLAPSILKFQEEAEEKYCAYQKRFSMEATSHTSSPKLTLKQTAKNAPCTSPQYKTALSPARYSPQLPPVLIHCSARPRLDTAQD